MMAMQHYLTQETFRRTDILVEETIIQDQVYLRGREEYIGMEIRKLLTPIPNEGEMTIQRERISSSNILPLILKTRLLG